MKNGKAQLEISNIQCRIINVTQAVVEIQQQMKMTRSQSTDCLNILDNPREDPEEIKEYKKKLDLQMETIMSQLMVFEGYLRKEQSQICKTLQEKDTVILLQRDTILKLANKNEQLRGAYGTMKQMLQNIKDRRNHCVVDCTCFCHKVTNEYITTHDSINSDTELMNDTHDDFERTPAAIPRTDIDEAIHQMNNDAIRECTISLNTNMSRPRRIVESGSIRELAKHHRQRRASGSNNFLENGKTPVTRSNSLPDAKLLHVMQARAKNLAESSSSHTSRLAKQETMPLLHSEAVLTQMAQSSDKETDSHKVNDCRDSGYSEHATFLQGYSNLNTENQNEMSEKYYSYLDDKADDGPPQFYDIDDDDVLNEDFGIRSGKFKHVKSPPNQSPNKNPKRPKEFKKRHKLKSYPDTERQ